RDASRLGALVRARRGGAARASGRHRPPAPDACHDLALGRDRALRAPASRAAARAVSAIDKFDRLARGYAAHDYADPERYAARRAAVALAVGPELPRGATVLDLACGDANMAEPLIAQGLRYRGVDGSAAMIAEARSRLGGAFPLEVARLDEYEPPEPVDLTLCLRIFYL